MNKRTRNDMLVAEYVLGTLRGPARRRFEELMEKAPELTTQVSQWQEALSILDASDTPIRPPGRVWRTIQLRLPQSQDAFKDFRHLSPDQRSSAETGMRPRLITGWKARVLQHRWQFTSFALAAALATLLVWPAVLLRDGTRTISVPVAVLASTQADHSQQMVVSFDDRDQKLIVTPLNLAAPATGHSLELWLILKNQKPESLGLIKPQSTTTLNLGKDRLTPEVTFAVSLEPPGGSPTGQPTGMVLYAGKVGKV